MIYKSACNARFQKFYMKFLSKKISDENIFLFPLYTYLLITPSDLRKNWDFRVCKYKAKTAKTLNRTFPSVTWLHFCGSPIFSKNFKCYVTPAFITRAFNLDDAYHVVKRFIMPITSSSERNFRLYFDRCA